MGGVRDAIVRVASRGVEGERRVTAVGNLRGATEIAGLVGGKVVELPHAMAAGVHEGHGLADGHACGSIARPGGPGDGLVGGGAVVLGGDSRGGEEGSGDNL